MFIRLKSRNDFEEWRTYARALVGRQIAPHDVYWQSKSDALSLFPEEATPALTSSGQNIYVPRSFMALAPAALCHSDPARFSLLYRVLFRLQREKALLNIATDADIARLHDMIKAVRRDSHKMKAFVRFREIKHNDTSEAETLYFSWFEPDHFILERTAPFFARRFSNMPFMIATPDRTAIWDKVNLRFEPGQAKPHLQDDDKSEDLWRSYYKSIFNPARLKIKAMCAEMPKKYWNNLPEARLIPSMIADASRHVSAMIDAAPTHPSVKSAKWIKPPSVVSEGLERPIGSLEEARAQSKNCQRCDLHCHATQTVFGEGAVDAEILFVGEQPGDKEDIAGKPFIGPAGQLFDMCLESAGIDRSACYVTNAVKHFKYLPRGTFRQHRTPGAKEINACRFWLDLERALIKPKLIVALGATAAHALTGQPQKILSRRGHFYNLHNEAALFMTVHPSFLLRVREGREQQTRMFIEDLKKAKSYLENGAQEKLLALAA